MPRTSSPRARRAAVVVSSIATAVVALSTANAVAAPGGPPSTAPASGTPQLSTSGATQQVRQLVQCGGTMYAVGTFSTITHGGTTYTRNNAFSFAATAPFAMTSWNPNVNGIVNSIAFNGSDCSTAYLGGKFTAIGGSSVKNIGAVSTSSGNLVGSFADKAGGQVETLLATGGHLLVGGYFSSVNNGGHAYFASVSPSTGKDDGYASLGISGNYSYTDDAGHSATSNPTRVYNQQLSNDGRRLLVEGDFTSIGGQSRRQIAMLDLGSSSVSVDGWHATEFNDNCDVVEPFYAQAAAWSPDDRTVYVANTGYKPANGPGFSTSSPRAGLCDAAAAFPATSATVTHSWINYTGCDSLYATAADASTAYFAGHERWASNPDQCDNNNSGKAVAAPGIVGLSPSSGGVTYNPTRARGLGADDMLITSAGLWVASDTSAGSAMCGGQGGHAGICLLPY